MGVVRGDRTAESQKLNRCSAEAQDFYGRFITLVPDDFGRFRCSVGHVFLRMYPRREPTPGAIRRVGRLMAELEREGLWKKWEADDVEFAELTGWSPHASRWHRTPEPPGTFHAHSGSCLPTAIARAREWGDVATATALSSRLKELRAAGGDREATGTAPGDAPGGGASVPSVPLPTDIPAVPAGQAAAQPATFLSPPKTLQSKRAVGDPRVGTEPTEPTSWTSQAGDDWKVQYNAEPKWARVGRALKPLVEKHGWPTVRVAWLRYLTETEAKFASAERFAETYGYWSRTALPPARAAPTTAADRSREAGENFLRRQREDEDNS